MRRGNRDDELSKRKTIVRLLFLILGLSFLPSPAFAYVDPGILGALYQVLYVLIFGVLASWIFRPWNYLKELLSRGSRNGRTRKSEIGTAEESQSNSDVSE